jgi:uncharacterized protein YqgV (UPF0045/DUF77 family)
MTAVRIEFLVEPFHEGHPGPHVLAGIDAARALGFEPEVGPFGTVVTSASDTAGSVVGDVVEAVLRHGATRVAIQVERVGE